MRRGNSGLHGDGLAKGRLRVGVILLIAQDYAEVDVRCGRIGFEVDSLAAGIDSLGQSFLSLQGESEVVVNHRTARTDGEGCLKVTKRLRKRLASLAEPPSQFQVKPEVRGVALLPLAQEPERSRPNLLPG